MGKDMYKNYMSRKEAIDSIVIGDILAFRDEKGRMLSAKVLEIGDDGQYKMETRNGSVYYIARREIEWVRRGKGWPDGIYNAFMKDKKGRETSQETEAEKEKPVEGE